MSEIRDRLIVMIGEEFGQDIAEKCTNGQEVFASHTAGKWEEGMIDSLDRVEFSMAVEEAFGIEIPDAVIIGVTSIDDLAAYVETMTAKPAHGAH